MPHMTEQEKRNPTTPTKQRQPIVIRLIEPKPPTRPRLPFYRQGDKIIIRLNPPSPA